MESTLNRAQRSAQQLASCLQEQSSSGNVQRIVFAESCTAGLVAALLGQVPGISNFLCGSAVTYRASVKQDWLGVSEEMVEIYTTESIEMTKTMALGVLDNTDEAVYSAAITGHLGPGAPPENDGKIFMAVAARVNGSLEIAREQELQLIASERIARQYESASQLLDCLHEVICP